MAAIKGVGESAVRAVIEEREKNGVFTSVFNFFERTNLSQCNKKNIENLVIAGAFDCFKQEITREAFFAPGQKPNETFLDVLVRYGNSYQQDQFQAKSSLFGEMSIAVTHPALPKNVPEWGNLERLNKERELVGIYLSAHPLDEYSIILNHVCNTHFNQLEEQKEELSKLEEVTLGGIVSSVRVGESRQGNPYGIVKMEDFAGSGELALFGKDWVTYRNFFMEGTSLYIKCKFEPNRYRPDVYNMNILSVDLLSDVKNEQHPIKKITLNVSVDNLTTELVENIAAIVKKNPGDTDLIFNIHAVDNTLLLMSRNVKVRVEQELLHKINEYQVEYKIN